MNSVNTVKNRLDQKKGPRRIHYKNLQTWRSPSCIYCASRLCNQSDQCCRNPYLNPTHPKLLRLGATFLLSPTKEKVAFRNTILKKLQNANKKPSIRAVSNDDIRDKKGRNQQAEQSTASWQEGKAYVRRQRRKPQTTIGSSC